MQADINGICIHFILYKEEFVELAISSGVINKAIGASKNVCTQVHFIDCNKEFMDYYSRRLLDHGVAFVFENLRDYSSGKNFDPEKMNVVISHDWPETLAMFSENTPEFVKRVVTANIPPLYDRLLKKGVKKLRLLNFILANPIVFKLLTRYYVKYIKKSDCYVSTAPRNIAVLEQKYGLKVCFSSRTPLDTDSFRYITGFKRDIIIVFEPDFKMTEMRDFYKSLKKILTLLDTNKLHIISAKHDINFYSNILGEADIICFNEKLNHLQIRDLMAKAIFSVIPEYKGAFELPPIESLSCGVPVIGYETPSVEIVYDMFRREQFTHIPFYDLYGGLQNDQEFHSWASFSEEERKCISTNILEYFNSEMIMSEFIKELKEHLKLG